MVRKKPKGRIIVLLYQLYGALMVGAGMAFNLLIRLDLVSTEMLNQAQIDQIKTMSLVWILLGLSAMLIRLAGGILLFMLKKTGFFLLTIDAVIQSISLGIGILKGFNADGMENLISSAVIVVWLIAISIAFYSWHLYRKELLS